MIINTVSTKKTHVSERHLACGLHVIKIHVTWNYFLIQWQRRME